MSDIEKPVPAAAGGKPTFLDKLSRFTIGRDRGELPEKEAAAAGAAGTAEQSEKATPAAPLTKWQKVKRHYRRFWICYLIGAIIIAAILLPILFIFIIPRIAQDLLNSGSIVIDFAHILQPTNNSVVLNIGSHVYVPGPFTVSTDPLQLQLYVPEVGSDYPMALLDMPEDRIHKNTSMNTVGNQFTPFMNYTSWHEFVHNTIFLDSGGLGLKGSVRTQLGKIKKFTLDLNKVVPSKALNQFKGFTIDSAALVPTQSDGSNLLANATLPNQSVLTLEIGNTSVNIMSGDLVIATGMIENLFLQPGNNTFAIRGKANLTNLIENLGDLLKYQGPYIKNGNLELTTHVTNIEYNGSRVPYYSDEMGKLPLTAQTPVLGLLLNTLKGFLHGNGTNATLVQEVRNKINQNHADIHTRFSDIVNNSTELELVARDHLETLARFGV
ncbi:hypothetical protein BGW36DRAFT_428860 [Talaromyces proteolyticus]|uniref:Uncharacterized protein n=1 Tax=Talaromyces proteolyticus TaxID=1131652 RepID=A0AAD4PUC7_9EURO|nr:uncharacterized protein BGW36DRAFT_428860 [Talaromyces proteolyticus]KAH8694961.1 hypothetical protein BGW36DRAFT_428860 [Talaromyces proteolyticus]